MSSEAMSAEAPSIYGLKWELNDEQSETFRAVCQRRWKKNDVQRGWRTDWFRKSQCFILMGRMKGENIEGGLWRKQRERLVLIDIDRDCNECGEGMAP